MSAFSDKVRGNWNIVRGKLKQQWGDLTDNDLTYTEGQEEEFLGRLQRRTGETKQNLKDFIDRAV